MSRVLARAGWRHRARALDARPRPRPRARSTVARGASAGEGAGWGDGLRRATTRPTSDSGRPTLDDDGGGVDARRGARVSRGRGRGGGGARRDRDGEWVDRGAGRAGRRDGRRRDDAPSETRERPVVGEIPRGMSRFYATCHPGLEEVVARELASPMIDAREVRVGKSGVSFVGTQRVGYDANLWLRSAVRVLVELKRGYLDPGVSGTESVYEFIKRAAPWEEVVPGVSRAGEALTFAVETRVWDCSQITSSHAAKIRVKDAVCDALVDATGTRPQPPINYAAADVPLYVTLYRDEVIVYRDMSGESLHRRGYRNAMHRASLSESAAAGMLSLAGWPDMLEQWRRDPDGTPAPVLIDPMCGSGTFLIEAALMAANVAPGLVRAETIGYAFERWPDHDQRMFDACLEDARRIGSETRAACASPPVIIGNDIHPGAVTLAGQGAETARVSGMVEIFRNNCETFRLPSKIDPEARRVIVTNPPWGKRIGAGGDAEGDDGYAGDGEFDRDTTVNSNGVSAEEALEQCWNSLGVFLKRECPDTSAFVLSGNPAVSRAIRMRASRKHVVGIGGVDCRLLRYDILPPKPPGYVPTHRENRRDERNW